MTRAYQFDLATTVVSPPRRSAPLGAEPEKRRWRTPPWLFAALNIEFGFDLDACADETNALCRFYIPREDNALTTMWHAFFVRRRVDLIAGRGGPSIRTAWMNPPWGRIGGGFPGTGAFVDHAWGQSRTGITVCVLVESATDTLWWKRAAKHADEVRIGPRVPFYRPDGTPGPQPPGGVTLFVFRPHVPDTGWRAGPRTDHDWDVFRLPGAPASKRRAVVL